ncbi:MAG: Nif3-like dinuclear metal center hexameric protein [Gemmataceae bacterium]
MATVDQLVRYLDAFAPPGTAAEWDNVGLLVGDPAATVRKVVTCLTLTDDVAREAIAQECQLIVTHHPLPFRGIKTLTASTAEGAVLLPLIRAGIAVYSPHTAFDNCPGGINDGLCERLELTRVASLRTKPKTGTIKLAVFVPEADLGKVSDAVFAAGAGRIGVNDRYKECSFRSAGTGTFFGSDESNPQVGQKGRREEVAEYRLETVVPESKLSAVVAAMRAAHSYEEPAYDLYPMTVIPPWGEGRIGEWDEPLALRDVCARVQQRLNAGFLTVVGDPAKPIRKLALACGAAGEFLSDAIRAQADCFLTGELRFHDALKARSAGIAVIIPGHYATERPGIEDLAQRLTRAFPDCTVTASQVERDPLAGFA